jgi:hypothetical protein
MPDTRKIRQDLTKEELERLQSALSYESIRHPDMRVEKFIPSRTQR